MSILAEQMFNEIQEAGGYFSGKPITTTATGTFNAVVAASQTVTGAFAINGALTVGGAATVTGAVTVGGALNVGVGGPQIVTGTLIPPANPTAITAPLGTLFINLGATGVTNRVYINTNGATGWTYLATSGA